MEKIMNGPLPYVGGKSKLSKTIVEMMPEHLSYVEVFAGGLWVFFKKDESKYEIINDLDSDLITFYRVIQNHLEEFMRQYKYQLASREIFEDFKNQMDGRGLTDIQRAARYYYLQRICFGGKVKNRTFGTSVEKYPRINFMHLGEELTAVHLRLSRTTIENLDWPLCIEKYDKEQTFFYLDPPYLTKPAYKHNFGVTDFERMAEVLKGIKGRFILSVNDHESLIPLFSQFNIEQVSLSYSVSRSKSTTGKELLIKNF